MNKRVICSVFILIALVFSMFSCSDDGNTTALRWIEEESRFVDYTISGDNIISFRYSICFVNDTEEDMSISISAKFAEQETSAWIKHDFLEGQPEGGDGAYVTIKKGEKTNVTYTFKGEYLGGEVNENLSFPTDIIWMLK